MAAARGAVGMIIVRTRADSAATPWDAGCALRRPARHDLARAGRHAVRRRRGLRFSADGRRRPPPRRCSRARRRPLDAVLDEAARARRGRAASRCAQTARVTREAADGDALLQPQRRRASCPAPIRASANEYVLLMAHLDHIGVREPRPNDAANADRINNGAMDNATGIATLIEVARAFSRPGNRPRRPILIAAVTAEEKGLLGAQYLARHPVVGNGRVISVVNLDMPILTYDFQDVTAFGAEHSTMGPIVARAAARMGVALSRPIRCPRRGCSPARTITASSRQGVPSVFLMTGFANGGRERFTALPRAPLSQPARRSDAAVQLAGRGALRAAQLSDRARDRRRGRGAALVCRELLRRRVRRPAGRGAPQPAQAASRPSSAAR